MKKQSLLFSVLLAVAAAQPSLADPWDDVVIEQYGSVEVDVSAFPRKEKYQDQDDVMGTITVTPQVIVGGDDYEVVIEPRVVSPRRGDGYVDLKEGYFATEYGPVDVLAGTTTVFWGKNEVINLVDVINTKDYTMGLNSGVKQGMPMVKLSGAIGPGDAEVLFMPHFVENRYADKRSRLRTPLAMKKNTSRYQSGTDKNDPSIGLRYSGYIGNIDYGISYFSGITRDPAMVMDGFTFVPLYHEITQTGLDLQWIYGDTSFKGELIQRSKQLNSDNVAKDYTAGVVGVEHALYGIMDSNADLVIFAEYARDTRQEKASSGMQDDVFLGTRLTLNDVDDSQISLVSSYDLDYASRSVTAGYTRRVADAFVLDSSVYFPIGMMDDKQFASFERDTKLNMSLKWSW